jgi:gliding motility-associated lipoprotein GldH
LYKYSNLFVLFTIQGPKEKAETQRLEFKLAEADGKWLGSGLGDIFSNQIKVMENVKFPRKGVYSFSVEQNMRDNPLLGIEDIGVRVEKR